MIGSWKHGNKSLGFKREGDLLTSWATVIFQKDSDALWILLIKNNFKFYGIKFDVTCISKCHIMRSIESNL
jgi:hypothetical protein